MAQYRRTCQGDLEFKPGKERKEIIYSTKPSSDSIYFLPCLSFYVTHTRTIAHTRIVKLFKKNKLFVFIF